MKKSILFIMMLSTVIMSLLSVSCITGNASTIDEAIISQQDDNYVALYTKSHDSSLKEHDIFNFSKEEYQLFYTQTTLLALIAGYLILFKIKGINNNEKMHKRRK